MNEIEIYQCLSEHPVTKQMFKGVYACDELANVLFEQNSLLIVNTDVRALPGAHWVVCFWRNQVPLFFDSYGQAAYAYNYIHEFFLRNAAYYNFNNVQLQSNESNVCGHYATYVSLQLCLGRTIQDIRKSHFSTENHLLNDRYIVSLFRKEFGYPINRYKNLCFSPMTCKCYHLK